MSKNDSQIIRKVIAASSVGTLIEWYDFYIFGSLATIISKQFFPQTQSTAALLSTLAIFAAGFIVRPFGALVFGRLGDLVGRKYTFMVTLILMGGSTFLIGLIPNFNSIGYWAPFLVLLLRLCQGLALGGEYGGAATYVAEHAPQGKRGFYTSWIQTTATLGLFLSLGIILSIRHLLGVDAFAQWGWRIPFLLSAVLVLVSIVIRMRMKESPLFTELKKDNLVSKNPIKDSFGKKENLKLVLLALFAAVMGQGVVWYTGQFYAQSFIENTCKIEFEQSRMILLWAIVFATPFFIVFGSLSDRVGRKYIMLGGMLLGILSYRAIYSKLLDLSDVKAKIETEGKRTFAFKETRLPTGGNKLLVFDTVRTFEDATIVKTITTDTLYANGTHAIKPIIKTEKTLNNSSFWIMVVLVFVQILFVTMVYGPIAAFLVELFPTKIRYTSMSLPYHIGNGVFGGLVPFISTLIYEYTRTTENPAGNPLTGLWYPIGVAAVCLIIGWLFLNEKQSKSNALLVAVHKMVGYGLMLLGPVIILTLVYFAYQRMMSNQAGLNDLMQWGIIIIIFIPIAFGLTIFGKYAASGVYDKQNEIH